MIVTTGPEIVGHRIVEYVGIVYGIAFREPQTGFIGIDLDKSMKRCEQARQEACSRMMENATALGADAVIGMQSSSSILTTGITEILAYGTAVKLSETVR